nr:MAG: putative lysis protein [Leviviridae sp.]
MTPLSLSMVLVLLLTLGWVYNQSTPFPIGQRSSSPHFQGLGSHYLMRAYTLDLMGICGRQSWRTMNPQLDLLLYQRRRKALGL